MLAISHVSIFQLADLLVELQRSLATFPLPTFGGRARHGGRSVGFVASCIVLSGAMCNRYGGNNPIGGNILPVVVADLLAVRERYRMDTCLVVSI